MSVEEKNREKVASWSFAEFFTEGTRTSGIPTLWSIFDPNADIRRLLSSVDTWFPPAKRAILTSRKSMKKKGIPQLRSQRPSQELDNLRMGVLLKKGCPEGHYSSVCFHKDAERLEWSVWVGNDPCWLVAQGSCFWCCLRSKAAQPPDSSRALDIRLHEHIYRI